MLPGYCIYVYFRFKSENRINRIFEKNETTKIVRFSSVLWFQFDSVRFCSPVLHSGKKIKIKYLYFLAIKNYEISVESDCHVIWTRFSTMKELTFVFLFKPLKTPNLVTGEVIRMRKQGMSLSGLSSYLDLKTTKCA